MNPELYHTIKDILTGLYIILSLAFFSYLAWKVDHPKATDYEDDEEPLNYTVKKKPIKYIRI
jgi:hypothetical protein